MSVPNFSFEGMSGRQIDTIATSLIIKYQPEVLLGGKAFDAHRFMDTKLEEHVGRSIRRADVASAGSAISAREFFLLLGHWGIGGLGT